MAVHSKGDGLYDGPIVDAHHHWWDTALGRHPWLKGQSGPVLGQSCLPHDYLRAATGYDLRASVHVEAGWDPDDPQGEIAWLDSLPRPEGIAARYVAYADLASPDVEATLAALARNKRVTGVRAIVSWHPDPSMSRVTERHLMMNTDWRAGLSCLEPLGFSLDLLMSPWQVDDACDLFASFPGIRFAINHCSSPFERSTEGMAAWAEGLKRLASAPNAFLKISDLVAYDPDWTEESLTTVARACLAAFGARRCMLGSDHPVATLHATFHQTYEHFRRVFSDLSQEEQLALFASNATEFYRVPSHPCEE
ncbi:amidohydrolase family protein [Manganibacter manganicus]|uniref:Amidohydrolase-related domain-containing protein n=1 Tax=Manganibacter manganicus TaxID=1873176 RepID=A0A1V8RU38_9HYPH|nr:amidohydrolase family protein [Pseudaminobacter manganicus]OQM76529.1 hypothetical protein BFN67_14235 [Pseudaminobacter manganicus]